MKRTPALVLLAVLVFAVVGCASGKKTVSRPVALASKARVHIVKSVFGAERITVTGTATFRHLSAGTRISCKGGEPTVTLPPRPPAGESVVSAEGGHWSSVGVVSGPLDKTLTMRRAANGRVSVSCGRE